LSSEVHFGLSGRVAVAVARAMTANHESAGYGTIVDGNRMTLNFTMPS
jgi:hypothetical protein